MRIPARKRREVRINLSPLIDVIFILLIFVFLAARFVDQERMDIEIPTSSQGETERRLALVLYLDRDGTLRFEGAPLARDKLEETLRLRKDAYNDLLLNMDKSLPVQRAVDVLSVARGVGYARVGLATQDPE